MKRVLAPASWLAIGGGYALALLLLAHTLLVWHATAMAGGRLPGW